MKTTTSLFLSLMTLGLFALGAQTGLAQSRIKVGTVAVEHTPWSDWFLTIKKRVEMEAGEGTQLTYYFGGSLGGEREQVEALKAGRLQIFGGSLGALASKYAPELGVFELPFLFSSDAEVDFVLEELRPRVEEILRSRGFEMLMWSENGWHGYGSKGKCLNSPAALKGMKMRSQQSRTHLETYRAFGAAPVAMAFPEVLGALHSGVVDGYSQTPLVAYATGWVKGAKYFSYTRHIYQPAIVVASLGWFQKQKSQLKTSLKRRVEEKIGFTKARALTTPLLQTFKENGLTLCPTSDEDRASFIQKSQSVWQDFQAQGTAQKMLFDEVRNAQKKFAHQQ